MTAPSSALLSDSDSVMGSDLDGSAVKGVSICFFCSSKELGGDGGVLAGACWTLATMEAEPLLGLISYCWMLELRPMVKRVAVGPKLQMAAMPSAVGTVS
jgi:hypothetical protein